MTDWLQFLSILLDELLRADGLGDSADPETCVECMRLVGEYRCSDCFGGGLRCSECILSSHHHLPLHRVQVRRVSLHPHRIDFKFYRSGRTGFSGPYPLGVSA